MRTSTETCATGATENVHPTLKMYNTLSKVKEPFITVKPGKVGIYLCGPTVYDKAHIGHMVGPVIFDCIKRYLAYCGYEVTWVVNITDVDDKLIKKATERGITMLEVAEENIADYEANLAALGVTQIDHFPRATDCMQEILDFIESLVAKGFAYASEGDVYFDVHADSNYGKLSNRSSDATQGEGGETASRKKNRTDFALWKSAKEGEPSWKSPWGQGRPGWHIECSAMSKKLLGEEFEIHGGGLDLVFPHHENEIAQSECCHGKPMARYWAHNGLLRASNAAGKVGGRGEQEAERSEEEKVSGKMSRSAGAGGLAELIARQTGERIRFFLLRTHYRSTVLFNEPAIEEAGQGMEGFYRLFKRYARVTGKSFYDLNAATTRENSTLNPGDCKTLQAVAACREKFIASMDDDFNTGGAIGELFELARLLNKFSDAQNLETTGKENLTAVTTFAQGLSVLKEFSLILGIFGTEPVTSSGADETFLAGVMTLLLELRASARENKDFETADQIRDSLTPAGITLEDRAGGTEWTASSDSALEGIMQLLISLRANARANKDFGTSDKIRDGLAAAGITLEDRAGGTEWSRG